MRWLIAPLAVALHAAPAPASGLVDNVHGLAPDGQGGLLRFSALLIGSDGRVEKRLAPGDKPPKQLDWRYDGKGRTLLPAFIDPHVDLMSFAIGQLGLDLTDAGSSREEALAKLAAYAAENADRRWLLAYGWTGEAPGLADLDRIAGDRPLLLLDSTAGAGWANSAARKLAGIATAVPVQLVGEALAKMRAAVPPPAPKDLDVALMKAQAALLARGITTIGDIGTRIAAWQAYRRAGDRGALRMRIVGYADGIDQMSLIAGPAPTPWLYDGRLRLGGIALSAGDSASAGTPLRNRISRAAMDGFDVLLTAASGPAGDEAEAAIEEVRPGYGLDLRWRIDRLMTEATGVSAPPGILTVAKPDAARGSVDAWTGQPPFQPLEPLILLTADTRLSLALARMTEGGARALGAQDRIGTLAPGQLADFVLLDSDIEMSRQSDNGRPRILSIWIGGRQVGGEGPK